MLKGKGMFIWQVQHCGGGNAQQIVAHARAAGITHVQVKVADGPRSFPIDSQYEGPTVAAIRALQQAGLTVWGWQFVYGRDRHNPEVRMAVEEADIAADRVQALGLTGFAVDLEETGNPVWTWHGDEVDCRNYMTRLRERLGPDFPIAACSHRFPRTYQWTEEWQRLWNEFMSRCNYAMPQVYWLQAHNAAEQLQTSYDQYRQLWPHLTYVPVGAAYCEGWANWTATPDEVRQFLQKARELNLPAASFWSWQHARNDPDNPDYPGTELWDAIATFKWTVVVVERPVREERPTQQPVTIVRPLEMLKVRRSPVIAPETLIWAVAGGTPLTVLEDPAVAATKVGVDDQWLHIRTPSLKEGYVAAWYVEAETQPDPRQPVAQMIPGESPYIYGIHDPYDRNIFAGSGRTGWVLFTEAVGDDPVSARGNRAAYYEWSRAGFGVIARLNNGYGGGGTVPGAERYANFAQACGRWVERSIDPADQQHGCHVWIIGNEMNNPREWPGNVNGVGGQEITPQLYAQCFNQARAAIQAVQGRAVVCPGVVDPYYGPGSDNSAWFLTMLAEITALDGIALHTYTHGPDLQCIESKRCFGEDHTGNVTDPGNILRWQYYHFYAYRTYMDMIPRRWRHLPVFITETDQVDTWADVNSGWVQRAYAEINHWNQSPHCQQIRCLLLYRWPKVGNWPQNPHDDRWWIRNKEGVKADFRAALAHGYRWRG